MRPEWLIDKDLIKVKIMAIEMLETTIHQYEEMQKALSSSDAALAQLVVDKDVEINDMTQKFIENSTWVIAKQQMVASDLRRVIGLISVVKEIEKIADYSKNICHFFIKRNPENTKMEIFGKMIENVITMLNIVKESFETENHDKAYDLFKHDKILYTLFKEGRNMLISEIKKCSKTEQIKYIISIMDNLKYMEKASDHLINIAELFVYIKEGRVIDFYRTFDAS